MIRLGVDANAIVCPQNMVGLGPFDSGGWFALHLSGKLNLGSCSCSQTCQQLDIKLDLWRFCWTVPLRLEQEHHKERIYERSPHLMILFSSCLNTSGIHGLDVVSGAAWPARPQFVESSDSVAVPLTFYLARHL